jgi:hypothetical protein
VFPYKGPIKETPAYKKALIPGAVGTKDLTIFKEEWSYL